jgi:hypothetical protein
LATGFVSQADATSFAQHFAGEIGEFTRLAQGDGSIYIYGILIPFGCGRLFTAMIRRLFFSAPSP